jgi:hypothetical protein
VLKRNGIAPPTSMDQVSAQSDNFCHRFVTRSVGQSKAVGIGERERGAGARSGSRSGERERGAGARSGSRSGEREQEREAHIFKNLRERERFGSVFYIIHKKYIF